MRKRKIKYKNEPIGKVKRVDDFLPKPKDLVVIPKQPLITFPSTAHLTVDFP